MSNEFEAISSLDESVQQEIIREAEMRLDAQLTVATAADQRALTFGGFLIATATAALGGGIALLTKDKPDFGLAAVAVGFACPILYASWEAIRTTMPKLFCLPGNRPGLWLPDQWESHGIHPPTLPRARIEQAKHLDNAIKQNADGAKTLARHMHRAFYVTLGSVVLAALALFGVMLFRLGEAGSKASSLETQGQTSSNPSVVLNCSSRCPIDREFTAGSAASNEPTKPAVIAARITPRPRPASAAAALSACAAPN